MLPLSKAQQIVLVESIAFAVVAILVSRLLFELQVLRPELVFRNLQVWGCCGSV